MGTPSSSPKSTLPADTVFVRWTCTKCDRTFVLPEGAMGSPAPCGCGAAMVTSDATRAEYVAQLMKE